MENLLRFLTRKTAKNLQKINKMQLTPTQLIKKLIVQNIIKHDRGDFGQQPTETGEEIDAAFDLAVEKGIHWDWMNEVRDTGINTNLPAPYNRNYETEIHAHLIDNQWVGFVYYFGGGKHGNPEEIEWMEDAFFLDCEEEEKVVVVRTFSKKEPK
jgi:hypothetical protein